MKASELIFVDDVPGLDRVDHSPYKAAARANPDRWLEVPIPERKTFSVSKTYRHAGFLVKVRKGVVYIKARPALEKSKAKVA
jgi:hypothetical protein